MTPEKSEKAQAIIEDFFKMLIEEGLTIHDIYDVWFNFTIAICAAGEHTPRNVLHCMIEEMQTLEESTVFEQLGIK